MDTLAAQLMLTRQNGAAGEVPPDPSGLGSRLVGPCTIRRATTADAEAIGTIYNREVTEGTATLDLVPRTVTEQEQWIRDRSGGLAVLVAEGARREHRRVRRAQLLSGPARLSDVGRGLASTSLPGQQGAGDRLQPPG